METNLKKWEIVISCCRVKHGMGEDVFDSVLPSNLDLTRRHIFGARGQGHDILVAYDSASASYLAIFEDFNVPGSILVTSRFAWNLSTTCSIAVQEGRDSHWWS